jgi:hypothetical protein
MIKFNSLFIDMSSLVASYEVRVHNKQANKSKTSNTKESKTIVNHNSVSNNIKTTVVSVSTLYPRNGCTK